MPDSDTQRRPSKLHTRISWRGFTDCTRTTCALLWSCPSRGGRPRCQVNDVHPSCHLQPSEGRRCGHHLPQPVRPTATEKRAGDEKEAGFGAELRREVRSKRKSNVASWCVQWTSTLAVSYMSRLGRQPVRTERLILPLKICMI